MAISPPTPALSSPGVGSGLDVNALVAKLIAVESRPLTALDRQEASYKARISVFGAIKGALSALQSTIAGLADGSALGSLSAVLADPTLAAVSAGTGAVAGSYALEVSQLAYAQKLASNGFTNTTDVVGSGSLTIEIGTTVGNVFTPGAAGAQTVTIAPGQNTLAGIRDAVNAAKIGVTATIINDGTPSGNRLVFTGTASGAAASVRITVADDDGNATDAAGLSQLAFDPAGTVGNGRNLSQKIAAQDAKFVIDGIDIARPSNTITDAIPGVTLTLAKTNIGAPSVLTVSQNTTTASKAVQAFVKGYNDLNATLVAFTKYDPATKTASVLTGDSTVRLVQTHLRAILSSALAGIGNGATTLSEIGVTFQPDGTLGVDNTKLNAALANDAAGVGRVFAAVGTTTDSLVSFSGKSDKTQAGTYALTVTRLATQGQSIGAAAAGLTITAGVDDQLTLNLDGVQATVTLSAGTYANAAALAAEVRAKVNAATAFTQNTSTIAASAAGGVLTLTSNRYGSTSSVVASGSAALNLLGTNPANTTGVDVDGTLGGLAVTGSGQTLTGAAGSPVEGLKLQVTGGTLGTRGNVSFSRGYAAQFTQELTQLLDANGVIAASTDSAGRSITDVGHRRTALQDHLTVVEAAYRAQFTALDTVLGSLSTTSSFLTQQFANLANLYKN